MEHPIAGLYVECDGTDNMREVGLRLRGRVIENGDRTFSVAFDGLWPAVVYKNSGWEQFEVLDPGTYFTRCAKDLLHIGAVQMGWIAEGGGA